MKLFISEPDTQNGFEKDLLGREEFGRRLTELVDKIDGPMVVALDGGWGSGKSVFLKMWASAHTKDFDGQAKIIYFDAFKHDFLDDPLTSLVGAIPPDISPKNTLKAVKGATARLAKPLARIALAAASGGLTELAAPVVDRVIDKSTSMIEDEFWAQADGQVAAMEEFEKALAALTKPDSDTPQRIVFIIDELDRCRPDYALSFLEIIKHFFAVPNVHFVLGVNLKSLQNSVRARYGTDIDAENYLKKFIHLTTRLPITQSKDTAHPTAITYFETIVQDNSLPEELSKTAALILKQLPVQRNLSLRDIERLYSMIALAPNDLENHCWGDQYVIICALVMRVLAPDTYVKISQNMLSVDDVGAFFGYNDNNGTFLEPISQDENYQKQNIFSIWARFLHKSPSARVLVHTKDAFSGVASRINRETLIRITQKYIETWDITSGT